MENQKESQQILATDVNKYVGASVFTFTTAIVSWPDSNVGRVALWHGTTWSNGPSSNLQQRNSFWWSRTRMKDP